MNTSKSSTTDINWLVCTETTAAKRVVCALLFLGHFSGQSRGCFGRPGRLCERVSWWLSRLFAPPAQGAFDYYNDYDLHWNHCTQCKKTVQTNNTLPACCTVFNRWKQSDGGTTGNHHPPEHVAVAEEQPVPWLKYVGSASISCCLLHACHFQHALCALGFGPTSSASFKDFHQLLPLSPKSCISIWIWVTKS